MSFQISDLEFKCCVIPKTNVFIYYSREILNNQLLCTWFAYQAGSKASSRFEE